MEVAHWRLKSKQESRFRTGHPWVFSNELVSSPKGIEPGMPVELYDSGGGRLLARGYGNPGSLIAFRVLSRGQSDKAPWGASSLIPTILQAANLRRRLGLAAGSHRVVFGEGDFLPGFILDRYRVEGGKQVFVAQSHTAGVDRLVVPCLEACAQELAKKVYDDVGWNDTALVLRRDPSVRRLEGLALYEPEVLKPVEGLNLRDLRIEVGDQEKFAVDLLQGQKTGFFLDQRFNIESIGRMLGRATTPQERPMRVLDLFCYVGQWSAHLASRFRNRIEVTLVDASEGALALAQRNSRPLASEVHAIRGDAFDCLKELPDGAFDVVIVDPPALIKSRKDIATGRKAYRGLNQEALRLVSDGGWLVSSSCSGLLEGVEFQSALAGAGSLAGKSIQWLFRGHQSPDHPILPAFPEGSYLKTFAGVVRTVLS